MPWGLREWILGRRPYNRHGAGKEDAGVLCISEKVTAKTPVDEYRLQTRGERNNNYENNKENR